MFWIFLSKSYHQKRKAYFCYPGPIGLLFGCRLDPSILKEKGVLFPCLFTSCLVVGWTRPFWRRRVFYSHAYSLPVWFKAGPIHSEGEGCSIPMLIHFLFGCRLDPSILKEKGVLFPCLFTSCLVVGWTHPFWRRRVFYSHAYSLPVWL